MKTISQKHITALVINIIFPLAGVSTDIYMPSLPAMAAHFATNKSMVQLTLTAYVVAMGIAQLFAGPISDAFGRKRLMLMSLVLQILATAGVLYAGTINWVIVFRFIQGIGAAFMMVPARAVINDVFTGDELKKQFNYSTISFALAPIVAPYIGGYLQEHYNWQANFIFMFIYSLLTLLLVITCYRETLQSFSQLTVRQFVTNYGVILKNKNFVVSSIFVSLVMGFFALFSVSGPFIIQISMKYSPENYGEVALLMGFAWFMGNIINRLMMDMNESKKVVYALYGILISALIMGVFSLYGAFNITIVTVPTFIMILLSGLIFPIYISNSLALFTTLSGSANGCLFSMTWLSFSLFTLLATQLKATSAVPLALTYVTLGIILLSFYYVFLNKNTESE